MTKFTPSHYAIVFEEVIKSAEARENFREFLKKQHNDEPLLFLNELQHYKVEYTKMKDALLDKKEHTNNESGGVSKKVQYIVSIAKNMIDTYFGNGPKGLNLSQVVVDSVVRVWKNVNRCMDETSVNDHHHYYTLQLHQPQYNILHHHYTTTESFDSSECSHHLSLVYYLEPHTLFGKVEYQIILDLNYDQFPRYARSTTLHNFLLKKGQDYTRTIAINVSNGYSVDIRFKPKDFQSQLMTEKDVFFAYTLAEDTPDWKELSYSDKPNILQTFVSKTSYSIGQERMKGMKLFKLVMHLPYPVIDVWTTYCDMNTRFKLDNTLMNDFKLLKYISPCIRSSESPTSQSNNINHFVCHDERENSYTTKNPPLALQIGELGIQMNVTLMKNRDLPHTMTSIYDESTNCYMNIGHTCTIENDLRRDKENRVNAEILFNYMFFGSGEKTTRFIHTVYTDLHVPFDSDLVLCKIWKQRSKQLQKSFEELLHYNTKGGTQSMDYTQINDHFQYFRSVEENSKLKRMWHKEYETKKRRSLSLTILQ